MRRLKELANPCITCGGVVIGKRSDKLRCDSCAVWHAKHRHKEDKRRYRREDPEKVRAKYREWQLRTLYGITIEQYNQLLQKQNHACAICKSTSPGKKDWHVDHCHSSGAIRGILCADCNLTLGKVKDSTEVLMNMVKYLEGKL